MPWCTRCDRFLNPNTVEHDGTCPSCGRTVTPGTAQRTEREPGADDDVRAPWHFWVMVAGVILYLGWRFVEGGLWVVERLF